MKKNILLTIAGIVIGLCVVFAVIHKAGATALFFPPTVQSAVATTTHTVFQAATATTSILYYDTYETGTITKTDDAVLFIQAAATSTSAVINLTREYAQGVSGVNCKSTPLLCDWYADNYTINPAAYAVPNITVSDVFVLTFPAAATTTKALPLPTPTRYVRINAKLTGAPGTIWAQIVPNKQREH